MKKMFLDYNFKDEVNLTLSQINFVQPTSIQSKIIPIMRRHQNVVGISKTGSGKTHAFLLPILDQIDFNNPNTQAIIISPTRELANQINNVLQQFASNIPNLRTSLIIGGTNVDGAGYFDSQIIVGTPGRLMDVINNKKLIVIKDLNYLVIDEADMLFDDEFIKDIDQIMNLLPQKCSFSIFSATINESMYPFIKKYFEDMTIIKIDNDHNKQLDHILVPAKNKDKYDTLKNIMNSMEPYVCLIFASKKEDVISITNRLLEDNIKCITLHGDLKPRERSRVLKRINNLEFKFVVCSDIASRGIDIDGVSHVISYDLPNDLEFYIHRSGRTGRNNYTGISYVIYNPEDESEIKKLEQKNVTFKYFDFKDDQLVEKGLRSRSQKSFKTDDFEKQMVSKVVKKNQKVKPGYKKKRRLELEKMKKKAKQTEIKQRIRAQRKKRKTSN